MDSLPVILFSSSFCLVLVLVLITSLFNTPKKSKNLPPRPPLLSNLHVLTKSIFDLEPIVRQLLPKYGPILSLRLGPVTHVYISDLSLARKALVSKGSTFSDRPPLPEIGRLFILPDIKSTQYGPHLRLLRRNLMSEILSPSKIKSFSYGRERALQILIQNLALQAESAPVFDCFKDSMLFLFLFMCFGQKVDLSTVRQIKEVQLRMLLRSFTFDMLLFFPRLSRMMFPRKWEEILQIRRDEEELLVPFIKARQDRANQEHHEDESFVLSYVDSLLGLELPDEGKRKLTEGEIVSLCTEFVSAGADSTTTTLQWIMANLVKHQEIQQKLVEEMETVVGKKAERVREEDLNGMPYLKAVILEGLRRHPPGHITLPHAVSEEVMLEGYVIPKDATVSFMVAEMGWDEKVWEDPMAFKPERFMGAGEKVEITGRRETKMIPFGIGRRICPAVNLAVLHLEYFVANLVWEFEWKAADGEEIDMAEKVEFVVVTMKKPLKAKITPRRM